MKKSKEEVSKSAAGWDKAIISERNRKGVQLSGEPRATSKSIEDFEYAKRYGHTDESALREALYLQGKMGPGHPHEDFADMKSQLMRPEDTDYHPWQAGIDERDATIQSGNPKAAEYAEDEAWNLRHYEQQKVEDRAQALYERWWKTGEPMTNGAGGHTFQPRNYRRK